MRVEDREERKSVRKRARAEERERNERILDSFRTRHGRAHTYRHARHQLSGVKQASSLATRYSLDRVRNHHQ